MTHTRRLNDLSRGVMTQQRRRCAGRRSIASRQPTVREAEHHPHGGQGASHESKRLLHKSALVTPVVTLVYVNIGTLSLYMPPHTH